MFDFDFDFVQCPGTGRYSSGKKKIPRFKEQLRAKRFPRFRKEVQRV